MEGRLEDTIGKLSILCRLPDISIVWINPYQNKIWSDISEHLR